MSASITGSDAALLGLIARGCVALAVAAILVWLAVFLVRVLRLRRARRDSAAEEELTAYVLDALASYRNATQPAALPRWKRAILSRVIKSLVEQTKGRDQEQLIGLLDRAGFRAEALAHIHARRPAHRQAACTLLSHFQDEESIAALRSALADPDFGVRLTAARALLKDDRIAALRPLLDQLRFDPDDPPLSLAELFAHLPASLRPEAVALLGAADLPSEWLRTLAIALARSQVYEAFEPIVALRHHGSERVRAATWVALRELGDPRAGDIVADGLGDAQADVRRAAAECAGKLGGPECVPALVRLAEETDWWVSYTAAGALWEFRQTGLSALAGAAALGAGAAQFVREKQEETQHG